MRRYIDITDIEIPSDDNNYDELVEFADAIAEQEIMELPEPHWISVFDSLPEEGEVVVALEKGKTWDCMTFEGTAEWIEDERMWKKNEATIRIDYWMPKDSALPEP